jgi:outer membrane protein assembly factor BamB
VATPAGAGAFESSAAVYGGNVYIGSDSGTFYAFDQGTGAVNWSTTLSAGITASPSVANGIVFVGNSSKTLYALAASYGGVLWSTTTGYQFYSGPTISDGTVFVTTYQGRLFAFRVDANNGSPASKASKAPEISTLQPNLAMKPARVEAVFPVPTNIRGN